MCHPRDSLEGKNASEFHHAVATGAKWEKLNKHILEGEKTPAAANDLMRTSLSDFLML